MEKIRKALRILYENKEEFSELERYARNKFAEHDKNQLHPLFIWTGYNGYEIVNETTLKIKIIFGVVESNIENHEYIYIDPHSLGAFGDCVGAVQSAGAGAAAVWETEGRFATLAH